MLDISQIDDMLQPDRPWVQWAESQLNMSASMGRRGADPETLNAVLSSLQLYATNLRNQLSSMDAAYKPVKLALDKVLFSPAKAQVQQFGAGGRMSMGGSPMKRPTPQSSLSRSPLDSPLDAPTTFITPSSISIATATLAFDFFPEVTGNPVDRRKCLDLCVEYMQQSVLPAVRLLHFLLSTISSPQWFRRAVVQAELAMKKKVKHPTTSGSVPAASPHDRFHSPSSRSNSKVGEDDDDDSRHQSPHSDTDTDEGEENLGGSSRNREAGDRARAQDKPTHGTTASSSPTASLQAAPQDAIKGSELISSTILPLIQQFFALWDSTVLRGVMSFLPFVASFHHLRQRPPTDLPIDPLGVSGGRDPPQAKASIFSPESNQLGAPGAMSRSVTDVSCGSIQEWIGLQRSFYQSWNECVTSFLAVSALAHEQLEGLVVIDLRLQNAGGPSSPTGTKSQRGRGAFNDTFSGAGSADGDSSLGDSFSGAKDVHSFDYAVQSAIQDCLKESVLRRGLIPMLKVLYTFTKYFCWGKLLRRSLEIDDKPSEGGRYGGLHPFIPQSSGRSDFQLPEIPPVSSSCDCADATYRLDGESLMLAEVLRGLAHVLRTTTRAEVEHGAVGLGYVDLCNDLHKFAQRLNDTLQLEVAKSVHTHLKSVARGTVSLLIVPGYLSQAWTSHTAYMKGEVVTPAVRTFEAQLQQWWRTLQLYRGPGDTLSDLPAGFGGPISSGSSQQQQQQQQLGGAPGMATPATMTPDGIPVVPAAAQRFHFHQLLTFALTLFIEECLLWVRCSEARAQQLRIDACFFIRAIRRWRLFYLSKHQTLMPLDESVLLPNGPDMVGDQMYHACSLNQQPFGDDNSEQRPLCIDCLLLRLSTAVSLRTCETEVVLKLIQHREGILLEYGQSSSTNAINAAKAGGAGGSVSGGATKPSAGDSTTAAGASNEEERPPQFLYDIWNAPAHTQLTLGDHFQPRIAGKESSAVSGQTNTSSASGARQLNIWTFHHGSQDFATPAFPPFVPPMALVTAREAAAAKSRQPLSLDRRGASPQKQREGLGGPSSGAPTAGRGPNSSGAGTALPGADDPALVAPIFLPPSKLKTVPLPFHYVTLAPYFTQAALRRRENPGTFATSIRVGCITSEDEKSVVHQLILSRWQQWDTYPKLTPEEEEHVKWIRSKTL